MHAVECHWKAEQASSIHFRLDTRRDGNFYRKVIIVRVDIYKNMPGVIYDPDDDPFSDDYVVPQAKPEEEKGQHLPGVDCCDSLETEPENLVQVIYDDETMATINEETGEVISVEDAPDSTRDINEIAKWLGEKLTWSAARITGLTAEKKVWIDVINKRYDPKINRTTRYQAFLTKLYTPIFETFARGLIFGDGTKKSKSKTLVMGLLSMNFTTTRARTDVVKQDEAIALLRSEAALRKEEGDLAAAERLKGAIKVTRTLLKSALPTDLTIQLEPDEMEFFLGADEMLTRLQEGRVEEIVSVPLNVYLEKKGLVHFEPGGRQEFHFG
jgi:hypothetical protein